jgi:hypothetical protein
MDRIIGAFVFAMFLGILNTLGLFKWICKEDFD